MATRIIRKNEMEEHIPLADLDSFDSNMNSLMIPLSPYESLSADFDACHVHFQRSQSLPQLSTEHVQHGLPRIRFLSGRASAATLHQMRTISTRTFSVVRPDDENQIRGNWDNPIEFFLSCLGYAVGLGNIWRFPYLCYRNGGGAFLIPYFTMLFGCGLPLMFMELALGQYSSEGPLTVWKIAPLFKGLGLSMVLCSTILAVYYNMITGWGLYYLFLSIRELLPWACCHPDWASQHCTTFDATNVCPERSRNFNVTFDGHKSKIMFAADQFFHNYVLKIAPDFRDLYSFQNHLVISLLFAWIVVFAVLMKGIKSIGKTVYFSSTFPYLILIVLLCRSLMEPGAIDGIHFYLKPNMTKLASAQVWSDAAAQIFYSTGVCFGGAITLASYNRFRNNLYRDAIIVTLSNSATSILSGFVVFSILGFMAHAQNTTVDQVSTSGPGLTFIAYPQAVTLLPLSPLWSALFFSMLITLALSTMFPTVENIATAIIDRFAAGLRSYKFWVMLILCVCLFLLGLPLTTGSGMYVLILMDTYGVSYPLLALGFIEVLVVAWVYGADRLLNNIETMLGHRSSIAWYYIWKFLTPSLLLFAIFFKMQSLEPVFYGDFFFPRNADLVGWTLTAIPLLPIPVYAIYKLINLRISSLDMLTTLTKFDQWEPALTKYRCAGQHYVEDDVFA